MSGDNAPLIVAALFAPADQARFDGLRCTHYPPALNRLPAHLTLFHHLPPSIEAELRQRIGAAVRQPAPMAQAAGLMNLGRGVAIRIVAPALAALREDLADAFSGMLTPQDAAGWRAHVTIQNKATPETARALLLAMERDFRPHRIGIVGIGVWRYRGGPWEPVSRHMFAR